MCWEKKKNILLNNEFQVWLKGKWGWCQKWINAVSLYEDISPILCSKANIDVIDELGQLRVSWN